MLEKANLSEEEIARCLREHYSLDARQISFLPLGNDANAWVYRAQSQDAAYFLKLKKGPVYLPALEVPHALRAAGIREVLAPLPTRAGQLYAQAGPYLFLLYPFIEGQSAMQGGMSSAQWRAFGSALRRIHASALPPQISARLERERFAYNPKFLPICHQLPEIIRRRHFTSPSQHELAAFWDEKAAEIQRFLQRAAEISQMLRGCPAPLVVCHTDIHTANIMLDPQGQLHIIDWDQPLLAPKERDLMFIGGGLQAATPASPQEQDFYTAYGPSRLDPLIIAYYAYEWVIQEIGDYAGRVFLAEGYTEITRQDSLRGFKQLFDPGDVVDSAYQADWWLRKSVGKSS